MMAAGYDQRVLLATLDANDEPEYVHTTDLVGSGSGGSSGGLTDTELRASPVPVSGPLTDAELRATPVPVSGTMSVNEPVTVDGTVAVSNFPATQPVSGPLTDAELRATPVPVSGTMSVTEPVSIDDNGGSITVDGPLTDAELRATAVPVDTELGAARLAADALSLPTAPDVLAALMGYNGATLDRLRVKVPGANLSSNAPVLAISQQLESSVSDWRPIYSLSRIGDGTPGNNSHAAGILLFNGSTWDPARGTVSDGQLVNLGANNDVVAAGNVAHDSPDSGNPQKIGYKAVAHTSITAVTAGDRVDAVANRHGIPWVIGGHPNIFTARSNFTAAQTDTAVVTVGAGSRIVVTRCSALCDKANSVDVAARVGFGAASTPTGTGTVLSHPGIAAGSGVVEGSGAGMLGIGADGEDLRITCEVPTGGSIDLVYSYYLIES
jgi:hypothetical protein